MWSVHVNLHASFDSRLNITVISTGVCFCFVMMGSVHRYNENRPQYAWVNTKDHDVRIYENVKRCADKMVKFLQMCINEVT